jgi:hypothetical protein
MTSRSLTRKPERCASGGVCSGGLTLLVTDVVRWFDDPGVAWIFSAPRSEQDEQRVHALAWNHHPLALDDERGGTARLERALAL